MNRLPYPSDLTDAEWRLLEPLPPPQSGGRPVKYPRREIVKAILYILRTAAAWRLLPHDFPPYRIVFHYYRLLAQGRRLAAGQRYPAPAAAAKRRPPSRTRRRHY